MKAVIMAGGKGTRISSIASDIPKPMIKIDGKPILEHEITCLKNQGFKDIILTINHLGNVIVDYFGNGEKFGVNIEYYFEKEPLGNAGALYKIKEKLNEDFLLINGDLLFDVDLKRFVAYHQQRGGLVTLFTHPNSHPFDSGLILTDENSCVVKWLNKEDERPTWYHNRVNAGLHIISPKILEKSFPFAKVDLDRDLLKPLCGTGLMFAYQSPEYIKDMGTPQRYKSVCKDYLSGIVKSRNLKERQKAIFLDRDGTINKYKGFLTNIDDFELIEGTSECIKRINNSGYLCIVVTNQPVIARGELTYAGLDEIHKKLETLLGNDGVYLDGIYFCPHHPDRGFPGEIVELKIDCDCRKPKPGLLLKASEDLNIDLSQSWIIGDSENDILAGLAAGCKTILLTNKHCDTMTSTNLTEAVNLILKE